MAARDSEVDPVMIWEVYIGRGLGSATDGAEFSLPPEAQTMHGISAMRMRNIVIFLIETPYMPRTFWLKLWFSSSNHASTVSETPPRIPSLTRSLEAWLALSVAPAIALL